MMDRLPVMTQEQALFNLTSHLFDSLFLSIFLSSTSPRHTNTHIDGSKHTYTNRPNKLYLHFWHGDRDGVRLDGEADALLHSGGETLRLLCALTAILPRTSGGGGYTTVKSPFRSLGDQVWYRKFTLIMFTGCPCSGKIRFVQFHERLVKMWHWYPRLLLTWETKPHLTHKVVKIPNCLQCRHHWISEITYLLNNSSMLGFRQSFCLLVGAWKHGNWR